MNVLVLLDMRHCVVGVYATWELLFEDWIAQFSRNRKPATEWVYEKSYFTLDAKREVVKALDGEPYDFSTIHIDQHHELFGYTIHRQTLELPDMRHYCRTKRERE